MSATDFPTVQKKNKIHLGMQRPRDGSGGAQSPEEPRTGGGAAGPDTQACGHSRRAVFTHRGMGSGRRVYASA